jgi:hypothetical protein
VHAASSAVFKILHIILYCTLACCFLESLFSISLYFHPLTIFFFSSGVWTQGFALAKQILYHLSNASSPFCCLFFLR